MKKPYLYYKCSSSTPRLMYQLKHNPNLYNARSEIFFNVLYKGPLMHMYFINNVLYAVSLVMTRLVYGVFHDVECNHIFKNIAFLGDHSGYFGHPDPGHKTGILTLLCLGGGHNGPP